MFLDFAKSVCIRVTESTLFSSDGRTRSVIDLHATTRPDLVSNGSVSDMVSDHCCVTAQINLKEPTPRQQKTVIPVPDMDRVDWESIGSKLLNAPLVSVIQGASDVNAAWAVWHQNFLQIVTRFIPSRYIIGPKSKSWMTSALHSLYRRKHLMFKAAVSSGSDIDWKKILPVSK